MRRHQRICALAIFAIGGIALGSPSVGVATPFVPENDAQVLERLAVSPLDPTARKLQGLQRQLAGQPDNLALATRVAWLEIEQGRALSDPRYYGHAQGALAPWWARAEPPVAVLVLRATIRQHDHDFDGALSDLSLAVQADPDNAQAWLTRAVILQVRGDYAEARRSCLQVPQQAAPLVAVICASGVESLSGGAKKGYDMLWRALATSDGSTSAMRLWALTLLAEIAARRGQPDVAEAHFEQAIALGLPDDYLLGAYADFLLDYGRPAAVIELLQGATRADALLLRLVLAEAMVSAPGLDAHTQALRDRFAAARMRGDTVHRREEARFALQLLQQPHEALRLARENWAVQREPWDARLLLEAALRAGDTAAAEPVLEFLSRNNLEDVQLARLRAQLWGAR